MNLKLHIKTAFGYFILAALLGLLLRSFSVLELAFNYKYFVHAHSHIALLGWVYLAITTLLYKLYLNTVNLSAKYARIFWFTQMTLAGMLFTFPFMGYAFFSIVFSTLFLFASYWFSWFFLKNVPEDLKKTNSFKCIKAALWYLVISSVGPWLLGAIMNILGPTSVWYHLAIYFYLHFLYNGFMILALVGIFLRLYETRQFPLPPGSFKVFFQLLNAGIVLSFFLSVLFANISFVFNILGGIGAIIQIMAFAQLIRLFLKMKLSLSSVFTPFQIFLLKTVVFLLSIKMILQVVSAHQYFADLATSFLDFIIGYLHLTFLGVVTIGLLLFLDYFKLIKIRGAAYYIYLGGFLITETLIFYRAVASWLKLNISAVHTPLLAVGSFIILLGLILMLWQNISAKNG